MDVKKSVFFNVLSKGRVLTARRSFIA